MTFLKNIFSKKPNKNLGTNPPVQNERKALEQKAVEGAHKALKEYRRVFERLAEYDRA